MNQGKLEVVKQEMARVVVVFGISELKWTGMGEFSSDDHYIYYCGQESLRKNGVTLIVNKRVQNAVLGCSLKNNRVIFVHFSGKKAQTTAISALFAQSRLLKTETTFFIFASKPKKISTTSPQHNLEKLPPSQRDFFILKT